MLLSNTQHLKLCMREHCSALAGTLWLSFIVFKNRGADLLLVEPLISQHAVHKGSL